MTFYRIIETKDQYGIRKAKNINKMDYYGLLRSPKLSS